MTLAFPPHRPHVTAIPTRYAGVQFRSRLEARWAAFFDACDWRWEYEPTDLHRYIPDFVLRFAAGPVLVEVKPDLCGADLTPHARKIIDGGWAADFVVCGAALLVPDSHPGQASIGVMGQRQPGPLGDGYTDLGHALLHTCKQCLSRSFHNAEGTWSCAVGGCYDGAHLIDRTERDDADGLWREAGNKVQWRPFTDEIGGPF